MFCSHYGTPAAFIPFKEDGKSKYIQVSSDFFANLMKSILNFYNTVEVPFDSNQTLEVMKIRDAVIKSLDCSEKWITL